MHHRIFDIDEILRHVVFYIMQMPRRKDAISLACCRKSFEEPVLSMVWEKTSLRTLIRLLPMVNKKLGVGGPIIVRAHTFSNPDRDTDMRMLF